jgi:uncharacterized protein YprB with RNaseH-like and TPR domain
MNFLSLDIETSNLNADFGFILCVVCKPYHGKTKVFRIDDYKEWIDAKYNDKPMIDELVKYLADYDGVITYFGKWFDIPFLNSELSAYGLPELRDMFHVDMHDLVKKSMKLHNNRLQTVIEYFNTFAEGKKRIEQKTHINALYYRKAITGDKSGIDELVKHCVKDVLALEQVYDILKSKIRRICRVYM